MRIEEQEDDIEEEDFYAVCDDIDLCSQDCFLLESSGPKSIEQVSQPVDHEADVTESQVHFEDSKNVKCQREQEPQKREDIGFAVKRVGIPRLEQPELPPFLFFVRSSGFGLFRLHPLGQTTFRDRDYPKA